MEKFEINWVLVNEIAISPAPSRNENFELIKIRFHQYFVFAMKMSIQQNIMKKN